MAIDVVCTRDLGLLVSKFESGNHHLVTLAKTVESQIERYIFEGELLPGDRLDEEELAARLSTSRTPIREALRSLASIGLVTLRPRIGASVNRPTMAEVVDLFEVVAELEGFAAQLACKHGDKAQLKIIADMHDLCRKEAVDGTATSYFDANLKFHRAIWRASENAVLEEQIEHVNRRVSLYRRNITFNPSRTQTSESEHEAVMAALEQQDGDTARAALREHVMILSDDVMHLARNLRL